MLSPILLFALVTYASGHLCGSNEQYVQACFTAEPTCRIWKPCKKLTASIAGCFCKFGTVRDEKSGCCVNRRQCGRCGRNEFRNRLGNCEIISDCRGRSRIGSVISRGRKCPVGYEPNYLGECCVICPRGTTRDKYGKCVTVTQVKSCEEGEVFTERCPVVQATCAAPLITTNLDAVECHPGCVCKAGQHWLRGTHTPFFLTSPPEQKHPATHWAVQNCGFVLHVGGQAEPQLLYTSPLGHVGVDVQT
ncbi:hypothetical protein CBL_01146 [Carabus blaptoides fortunei]